VQRHIIYSDAIADAAYKHIFIHIDKLIACTRRAVCKLIGIMSAACGALLQSN
jgi:hypothetical protein